jgi:hypothetical protein
MGSHGTRTDWAKRTDALRAVRARSRGRDVAEIREDLHRELVARGVEVPDERLGQMAQQMARTSGLAGSLHLFKDQLSAFRRILHVLKESEGPDWLRPPKGNYPQAAAFRSVPLEGVGQHQDLVARVYRAVKDSDDDEVVVCAWLSTERAAAEQPGRVQVHAGDAALGYLSGEDSPALYRMIEAAERRGRVIWVDSFIVPAETGYAVEVSLPARR